MGSIYKRGKTYWVKYYRSGKAYRESSGSVKHSDAKRLLKLREGDGARGIPVTPKVGRARFDELAQDVVHDYLANQKRTVRDLQTRIDRHVGPFFGGRRAASITTADIRKYITRRQAEGAANAGINRELSVIRRAFNLAMQSGKMMHKPYVPMLKENNVRTGFFEPEQFSSLHKHLPDYLKPFVHFAYITGWRRGEISGLQSRQIDFEAGRVTLDPGTTKNDEGRVFPFTRELRALLENQERYTSELQREEGKVIPWVFHRKGKPIGDFRKAWATACKKAGVPGRIPHDFRRTAVRNLVRAGVPERVAMQMTGHKTRSVFERYNIVSEGDLDAAARRLDEIAVSR
jgi:integrase